MNNIVLIPLSRGLVATIDEEDAALIGSYRWYAVTGRSGVNYAVRHGRMSVDGNRNHIYLHRVILGLPPGRRPLVDHRNGDGLDCRRSNLRETNPTINSRNSKIRSDNTSGHMGVARMTTLGVWRATITVDGRVKNLGDYRNLNDAVEARRKAEIQQWGMEPQRKIFLGGRND